LGKKTGIEIQEFEGRLEQPTSVSENVQLAIGQGTLQVSPLQVASFVAAVGNGGTLYRPTVVDKIVPVSGGDPVYQFEPDEISKLPVTEENLAAIQEAMVMVVRNPRGTATNQLSSVSVRIAGKTGTAENPIGDSHAWFAGYTFNNDPNKPDIAVAIILENAGEGSEMAAPLFRRVVQLYFSNNENPGGTMPWEESPYVTATETPEATPE
jgi:penicillin-binding protein 2